MASNNNNNEKKKKKKGSQSDAEENQEADTNGQDEPGTSAKRDTDEEGSKSQSGTQQDEGKPGTSNTGKSVKRIPAKEATSLIRRETATLPIETGPQAVEMGTLKYPLSLSTHEERRSVQPALAARISQAVDGKRSSIHSDAINTYVTISKFSRSKESINTLNVAQRDPYYYNKEGAVPIVNSDPEPVLCCNRFRCKNFMRDVHILRLFAIIWGSIEVSGGFIFSTVIYLFSEELDRLYDPSVAMVTALLFATVTLFLSGILLIVAVTMKLRALTWTYITISTLLCMYMFVMSIIMIHHALINLERDVKAMIATKAGDSYFLFGDGVVMGFVAMSSSVLHFIGNILVCIFYNIRYVQPLLLNKS